MGFPGDYHTEWDLPWVNSISHVGTEVPDGPCHKGVDPETLPSGPYDLGLLPSDQAVESIEELSREDPSKGFLPTGLVESSLENLEPGMKCPADSVLEGEIPAPGPSGEFGVVLEDPKELADFQQIESLLRAPLSQEHEEEVSLVLDQPDSKGPRVEPPTDEFPEVVIPGFEFIPTERRWDQRVRRETEDMKESSDTGADRPRKEQAHICIQIIINMHVVGGRQSLPGWGQHSSVDSVGVSASKGSYLVTSRGVSHLEGGQVFGHLLHHGFGLVLPQVPGQLPPSQPDGVKIGR